MRRSIAILCVVLDALMVRAQTDVDTIVNVYQLGEVVVHGGAQGLQLEGFFRQVMEDTTFYHAFLNTKYHAHAVESELRVRDKKSRETAGLYRKGRMVRTGPMAELVLDSVREIGKLRDRNGGIRFLTAEMYDDVFFPKGQWRASNRIAAREQEISRASRFDKYKSELKKFMFNPGQEIASVPFIGDKLDIFDPDMAPLYDYSVGSGFRDGRPCWLFTAVARDQVGGRPADEDDTVIKRMLTWFDQGTMNVLAREYRMRSSGILLDFDISIRVSNAIVNGDLVPMRVDYDGDWDIPFKKRELVRFNLMYEDWIVASGE
ncbi:MAG TPA: hypothetical protein PL010_10185 [Flavobacteriales bacterium]|jgi:hypothetical protein|nr:hypothetical protein [Flavobacteriales bacterium]HMW95688.1 hypothetical protein [Flavobacteriales bacterium]HMZ48824.1 hypothetical protein [Flavobacteriales bacterium]HNE79138.1 hypothetical protein [Flavobacteriales bacterium]HNI04995.1 hypothetical protein [Flavobacteriales bacterium]